MRTPKSAPITSPYEVLPDVLRPGLSIVFCGTAPGSVSAARGFYYAHPHNKFWPTLHNVGLTPRRLAPEEYALLPSWRIGLTDLAKRDFGMDKQLPPGALGAEAAADLRARIEACQPRILAFTSLTAGRKFLRHPAGFGEQPETIGRSHIWLLPSPSPAAQWNWDISWWRKLAERASELP